MPKAKRNKYHVMKNGRIIFTGTDKWKAQRFLSKFPRGECQLVVNKVR
jgi:hypothetical protein